MAGCEQAQNQEEKRDKEWKGPTLKEKRKRERDQGYFLRPARPLGSQCGLAWAVKGGKSTPRVLRRVLEGP